MERQTYLQTEDILDATIAQCEYMRYVIATQCEQAKPGERLSLLLQSLQEHTQELEHEFVSYRSQSPVGVRSYFAQYSSDTLETVPAAPEDTTFNGLLKWVLDCNNRWEEIYRELAFGTSIPEEKEAYTGCADAINSVSRGIALDMESAREL